MIAYLINRYIRPSFDNDYRRMDLECFWPELKYKADNIEEARKAFANHAMSSPAWNRLAREEIDKIIKSLT